MNDDMMFEYLIQMGAMRPEQDELRKRQAMVDALRGNALAPMQGEMVGKHYVAPGIGQALAQLGQGYMAAQGQKGVDAKMGEFNIKQRTALEDLRRRRRGGLGGGVPASGTNDPYGAFRIPDDRA